jgi:hypothetical protein
MHDESCNDHECDDGIEYKRNQKEWSTKVDYCIKGYDGTVRLRGLVDEEDPCRCTDDVSHVVGL